MPRRRTKRFGRKVGGSSATEPFNMYKSLADTNALLRDSMKLLPNRRFIHEVDKGDENRSHIVLSVVAHGGYEDNRAAKASGAFDSALAENVVIFSASGPGMYTLSAVQQAMWFNEMYSYLLAKGIPVLSLMNIMRILLTTYGSNHIGQFLLTIKQDPVFTYVYGYIETVVNTLIFTIDKTGLRNLVPFFKGYNTIDGLYRTTEEVFAHNELVYENTHAELYIPHRDIIYASNNINAFRGERHQPISVSSHEISHMIPLNISVLDVRFPQNAAQKRLVGKDTIFDHDFMGDIIEYTETTAHTKLSKVLRYCKETLGFKHVSIFSIACRGGEHREHGEANETIGDMADPAKKLNVEWGLKRHTDNYRKVKKHMHDVGFHTFGGRHTRRRRMSVARRGSLY
jgi:hypothetical protein